MAFDRINIGIRIVLFNSPPNGASCALIISQRQQSSNRQLKHSPTRLIHSFWQVCLSVSICFTTRTWYVFAISWSTWHRCLSADPSGYQSVWRFLHSTKIRVRLSCLWSLGERRSMIQLLPTSDLRLVSRLPQTVISDHQLIDRKVSHATILMLIMRRFQRIIATNCHRHMWSYI